MVRIAIPMWSGSVSTVFDFARRLLLVDIDGGRDAGRREVELPEEAPATRVARLSREGVSVLVCGAISRPMAQMLAGAGIEVVPFVSGPVEEVLRAYLGNRLQEPSFLLPGCAPGMRRRWGRGRGGRGLGRRGRRG